MNVVEGLRPRALRAIEEQQDGGDERQMKGRTQWWKQIRRKYVPFGEVVVDCGLRCRTPWSGSFHSMHASKSEPFFEPAGIRDANCTSGPEKQKLASKSFCSEQRRRNSGWLSTSCPTNSHQGRFRRACRSQTSASVALLVH